MWDSYWAQGFLTSFGGTFDGNYEGTIRDLWHRRFASLADGARVLDVGTGNGAIALLAASAAQELGRQFEIDALDLADIQPARHIRTASGTLLDQVRFHPRTDASRSGFANGYFDFVSGNFALEYTDWPATVSELTRVTAQDGEHMFVMHSDESVIAATAVAELAHIDLLLNKTCLFELASELIAAIGADAERSGGHIPARSGHSSLQPATDRHRLALNAAASGVATVIGQSPHPEILRAALGDVSRAYRLSQSGDRRGAQAHLARARREIEANAARLSAQRQATSTRADIARLLELYQSHGYTDVCIDKLSQEQAGPMAWIVRVRSV